MKEIRIRELINKLEKWERDFGPNCQVSIDWDSLYNWKKTEFYPFVSDVTIVGQNEVCIEFE